MPKRPVRPSARRCTRLKSEPGRPCAPNPGSAAPAEAGPSCSILHLEDDAGDADLIQATLQQQGIKCRLRQVKDRAEYVAALASPDFDLILADLSLPSFDGWTALDLAQKACPEIPFIFLSGTMSQASAAQSFQRGAADCLSKNDLAHLAPSVLRVIEVLRERSGRRRAEQERDQFFRLSADLLCVVGFDGCFQKINPALEQALGIPAAQLHGKQLLDLVHPEDGPAMSACLARLHQEAPPQLFESRLRGHDGTYLWLQWTATALRERRVVYASARDVTERKRGEEALRLSEARTRAIIDSALDCVIAMDADGRIVEFNPAAERTFGYIRGEVMGRPLAELIIPPSLREKQSEGLARLLRTGDSSLLGRRIEVVAMRRDGSEFPVELAVSRLAGDGAPHFTACLRDITERKMTEAEIQKLAAFPRLNPQAILEFSATGALTYFNDAALELARTFADSHPSGLLPSDAAAVVARCLQSGQSQLRYETVLSGRTLSWSFYPITASQVVHCYASEITERKHTEEQLREQAALLDKAHDAILVRDLDHRILFWNKGAEHIFGWTSAEAVGRNALELLSRQDGEQFIEALQAVLAQGEWSGELRQTTKSARPVDMQSRWTLVRDDQGQPKAILVLCTDITEKKQLEAQFLRAQRLESIGSLASGIAHDLNNILAPILMSVNLLQETHSDPDSSRLLEILRTSVQRGADMVKQILSFTRGRDGARAPVNLHHLIGEIGRISAETFPRNIRIHINEAKNLWPVLADATQMHQVLMNLCVNARDAMAEGGTLDIAVENILLDGQSPDRPPDIHAGPYVKLTVTDSGTGIAPETLERIFEPFFTTKPQGQGTGLGLPTVLNIVKAHGGFIQTQSQPGCGTSFRVFLPAAETSSKAPSPEPAPLPPQGRGERILVIDDERAFQEITKAIFEKHGYRVLTASDGAEALAVFAQHKGAIDLVMTDMVMPFLDGPATIKALRSIDPHVRILAASGLSESEKLTGDLTSTAFLLKPFTSERLLTTVDEVLHPGGRKLP